MSKQVTFAGVVCLVLLFVGSQSVLASDPSGRLRFGGSVGMAMSEQEDLNDAMDDVEDLLSLWEVDWDDSELSGAFLVGAYTEYLINENWVVGAEFLRLSSSGGYDWYLDNPGSTDADVGYDATSNLASAYGVYRLPIGESPVALRFGAGVGYLYGAKFEMHSTTVQDSVVSMETIVLQQDLEASGSAVAFHGLVGAEYELTGNLFVSANIAYRVLSVGALKVDKFSATRNGAPVDYYDIEEGKTLRWDTHEIGPTFSTREGDKLGLDFSGLHFTLGVAYVF